MKTAPDTFLCYQLRTPIHAVKITHLETQDDVSAIATTEKGERFLIHKDVMLDQYPVIGDYFVQEGTARPIIMRAEFFESKYESTGWQYSPNGATDCNR